MQEYTLLCRNYNCKIEKTTNGEKGDLYRIVHEKTGRTIYTVYYCDAIVITRLLNLEYGELNG